MLDLIKWNKNPDVFCLYTVLNLTFPTAFEKAKLKREKADALEARKKEKEDKEKKREELKKIVEEERLKKKEEKERLKIEREKVFIWVYISCNSYI